METIDDIVREMRKMGENYSKSESNDCRYVAYWLGTTFADRIEAAHKREVVVAKMETTTPTCDKSSQVGNAAAMYEALESVNKIYDMVSKPCIVIEEVRQACQKARAVLISTTPRNCDRYKTCEEALKAYGAPVYGESASKFLDWLFAEAKGENK